MENNKQQKINIIKYWLQRYGDRDDETFSYHNDSFYISLPYYYDKDGNKNKHEPFCLLKTNGMLNSEYIEYTTEEQLDTVIFMLNKQKEIDNIQSKIDDIQSKLEASNNILINAILNNSDRRKCEYCGCYDGIHKSDCYFMKKIM